MVSLGLTWFHLVSLGSTWFHLVSKERDEAKLREAKRKGEIAKSRFGPNPTILTHRAHADTTPNETIYRLDSKPPSIPVVSYVYQAH